LFGGTLNLALSILKKNSATFAISTVELVTHCVLQHVTFNDRCNVLETLSVNHLLCVQRALMQIQEMEMRCLPNRETSSSKTNVSCSVTKSTASMSCTALYFICLYALTGD